MIDTLVPIMGLWGFRALVVWAGALVVFLVGCTMRARSQAFLLALALVIGASLCARKNLNDWYASIRTDRRDEINAALADREPQEGLATVVRFAEDDPEDRVEGGVSRGIPAWRAGGVKLRGGGVATNELAAVRDAAAVTAPEGEESVIYMKADRVSLVRLIERGNRLAIHALALLILLGLAWDYAAAFNSIRSTRPPLPLSSPWIDALSPKSRALVIRPDVGKRWRAEPFLARAVRKGENVVYFGQSPIWEGQETLPRLSLCGLSLWRVPIFRYGAAGLPQGSECAFDAAWFGRYVVTITNDAPCREIIEDFVDILTEHRRSGARSERTLVIAWDRDETLDKPFLVEVAKLAHEANLSLFVYARSKCPPEAATPQ